MSTITTTDGTQIYYKGAYFCIKAFSETDLTEDLKKIDVPTPVLHGDDDQIVPIADSAFTVVEDYQERQACRLQRCAPRHVHNLKR